MVVVAKVIRIQQLSDEQWLNIRGMYSHHRIKKIGKIDTFRLNRKLEKFCISSKRPWP
jgi:hypothetical protein